MANMRSEARLQSSVADIRRLLSRHRLVDGLAARQGGPKRGLLEDLQHRQNAAELQRHVQAMHAADVAYALEALPLDDRRSVWEQVTSEQAAQVFVEVDAVVRESLVDMTAPDALLRLLTALDPEDLAYVSEALPADVLARASGGKIVGRLTVDAAMDVMRGQADLQALRSAGLREDEDLFAPPLASARNRWPWLGINLVTAFVASRVIGQFESTIGALAPLAALMPIVASIGGNTGNQTMAIVIRALAGDRVQHAEAARLMRKELVVSLLNGTVWGAIVGLFAFVFYASAGLGLVMSSAVVLNLVVAAVTGVAVPLLLHGAGRDPAQGSSVLLTFATDAMGFFLFLGLASVFLV